MLRLDNFRVLRGCGWPGFKKMKLSRMNKGHAEGFRRFVDGVADGGDALIRLDDIEHGMRATFAAVQSAESCKPVVIE